MAKHHYPAPHVSHHHAEFHDHAWKGQDGGSNHAGDDGLGQFNKGGRAKKWISGAIRHKGALHESLGVPAGHKIPASKLAKAAHSKNPTTRKRAVLAKTLKSFHHG
jgi:hypothetical protein